VIRALLLAAVLAFGFSSNSFSQEKKAEKKVEKKTAKKTEKKKAAAPSQDWGRFNTGAKRDLEKIEKKDAKGKQDPKGKKDAKQP
jgi:hypothetical protein